MSTYPYSEKYAKYADEIAKSEGTFLSDMCEFLGPEHDLLVPAPGSKPKQLMDVMNVDLFKDKSAEEIKSMWLSYHRVNTYIAATIPTGAYIKLKGKGAKFPTFLLPLVRPFGLEFVMCKFHHNVIYFTPLLLYQALKVNAPECLRLTYYTEFKDDKGIILVRGEYNTEIVDIKEACSLANQILKYYIKNDDDKNSLFTTFNEKPDEFKHEDITKQIGNLSV